MKKILLEIENKSFSFFIPANFYEFLSVLLQSLFLVFFPVLIFLVLFSNEQNIENNLFNFLITFVSIGISVYLVKSILFGNNLKVDPPGFIFVLVFALCITFSSFVSSSYTTNSQLLTFGSSQSRTLSSVFALCILGLYFLSSYNFKDYSYFKKFLSLNALTYIIFLILSIFINLNGIEAFLLLSSAHIFAIIAITCQKKLRIFGLFLTFITLIYFFYTNSQNLTIPNIVILFVVLITLLLPISVIFTFNYIELNSSKNSNKNLSIEILKNSNLHKLLLVYLILLFIFIYLNFTSNTLEVFLTQVYDKYLDYFNFLKILWDDGATSFLKELFFGVKNINYNSNNLPFMLLVLINHGLFGFVGFLAIYLYGFYAGMKSMFYDLNSKKIGFIWVYAFVIIFISIFSFLSFVNIFMSLLWWISLSLTSFYLSSHLDETYLKNNIFHDENKENKNFSIIIFSLRVFLAIMVVSVALLIFTEVYF
ncbi:MAG: hypothetical protein KatS3mg085_601 [Candidatus Dojkabacteria bacterium]|nr:MAG: hypothetical protein KatS3mg085_601 [Candidatus Dojkabacteria bacterium]